MDIINQKSSFKITYNITHADIMLLMIDVLKCNM